MAQPTNTFDSYDQAGTREDLSDIINMVSPMDTPFYSTAGKVDQTNTYHEWQTDSLRASAANANIEGDATTASARTATVRLGNYSQIVKDAALVSGTDEGLNKAGRGDELDYQMVSKIGPELKLDLEKALLDSNARVAGNSTTARELAGVPAWITTNTSAGSGGSDPTGDGTDTRTDGTQRAFSQSLFDSTMQSIWENSRTSAALTCLIPAFQMNTALTFTGNNNQRATVPANDAAVYNVVDVYVTPWGTVDFVMSREMRAREVMILNMDYWKVSVLRDWQDKDLPADGDFEKRQLLWEGSLEACNEAASGIVADLTTS